MFEFIETLTTKVPGLILPVQLSLVCANSTAPQKTSHQGVSGHYHVYVITFDLSPFTASTP